jgi:hypothetical protein
MFADKPLPKPVSRRKRILNLSKDIVPFFWFVNERVIEKYGRVRCINIFADYGLCVFHYEVYSFELNLLIIHLRNYEAFVCFLLIFTKEY